jgi:hypothetical protein
MSQEAGDPVVKFFVDRQNQATVRCPKCGTSKIVDTSKLKDTSKRLRVTCKCGETFKGEFEFRKHYRKTVRLPGRYIHLDSLKRGDMLVVDVSRTGIGFTTATTHGLKVGDHLEVDFTLDDTQRSEIRMKVTVRSVKNIFIGAEHSDTLQNNPAIGFYLM